MRFFRANKENVELNAQLGDALKKVGEVTTQLLEVAEDFKVAVKEFRDDE